MDKYNNNVVIYPLGNSDLNIIIEGENERIKPKKGFRSFTKVLYDYIKESGNNPKYEDFILEIPNSLITDYCDIPENNNSENYTRFEFNIIKRCFRYFEDRNGINIIYFIYTNQNDKSYNIQDTIYLAKIIEEYFKNHYKFTKVEFILYGNNPTDFKKLKEFFDIELSVILEKHINNDKYINMTTGTPQFSSILSTLSQEWGIDYLYFPRIGIPEIVDFPKKMYLAKIKTNLLNLAINYQYRGITDFLDNKANIKYKDIIIGFSRILYELYEMDINKAKDIIKEYRLLDKSRKESGISNIVYDYYDYLSKFVKNCLKNDTYKYLLLYYVLKSKVNLKELSAFVSLHASLIENLRKYYLARYLGFSVDEFEENKLVEKSRLIEKLKEKNIYINNNSKSKNHSIFLDKWDYSNIFKKIIEKERNKKENNPIVEQIKDFQSITDKIIKRHKDYKDLSELRNECFYAHYLQPISEIKIVNAYKSGSKGIVGDMDALFRKMNLINENTYNIFDDFIDKVINELL
jgi:hypothetical protein